MEFKLPKLGYSYDALSKAIDHETMEIHYLRHHGGYVNNLNAVLKDNPGVSCPTLDELLASVSKLPENIRNSVVNNGGGHWNHSFFWSVLTPREVAVPKHLLSILEKFFGGVEPFKNAFKESCMKLFGSGWCWLILDEKGELRIINTPNQDNPIMELSPVKGRPVFGLDLWEHAYYLRYRNLRGSYVDSIWSVVNWEMVENYLFSPFELKTDSAE